jgi:hypothetical protein
MMIQKTTPRHFIGQHLDEHARLEIGSFFRLHQTRHDVRGGDHPTQAQSRRQGL